MIFKPYYYFETGCAAYLFGCGGLGKCAVVDAHEEDVDSYLAFAASKGIHAELLTLPGDLEVYPGHFAGSACGARILRANQGREGSTP